MEKEPKYTNVRILYDNKNGEYSEAWAVIDGVKTKINNPKEVKELAEAIMKQDNVDRIDKSPSTKIKFMYDEKENGEFKKRNLKNYRYNLNSEYEVPAKLRLVRNSKYNGKKTSGVKKFVVTAAVIAAALAAAKKMKLDDSVINFIGNLSKNNEKEADIELASKIIDETKTIPENWEEYLTYEDSVQKEFAVEVMETLITPNIITKEMDGETITYGLTPEQATAFSLYYNSPQMSNEDILAIIGDYSLTGNSDKSKDLVNLVNSSVDTICLSWAIADSKEEMIKPVVKDQEIQDLIEKYMDLILNYKKAEKSSDKSKAKKAIEEALSEDFINAGDGKVVNLYEQPAAHVILNSVPATMNYLLDPLNENINKMIVGTEANYNVPVNGNKINIPETRGLVDDACSRLIERFDNFDKFYQEKIQEKTTVDRSNEFAKGQIEVLEQQIATVKETRNIFNRKAIDAQVATYEAQIRSYKESLSQSEYDNITAKSFEFNTHDEHEGVIIPIMNEYVKTKGLKGLGEGIQKFAEQFHEMLIAKIQAKQLNNNKPFSKSNPSGGKVGDSFVDKTERKTVSESELTSEQIKAAQEEANKKAGTVSKEEGESTAKEVQSIVNEILTQKDALLNHYINGGPSAPEYNAGWANSEYEAVRNQYNAIKNAGIKAYNEIQEIKNNGNNQITDEGADNTPSHSENPNQSNNNNNSNNSSDNNNTITDEGADNTPSHSETPDQSNNNNNNNNSSANNSIITDEGADNTPSHSENPNQKNNSVEESAPAEKSKDGYVSSGNSTVDINMDGVIEGTVTTDSEDVFNPSDYGIDMTSLDEEINTFDIEAAATAMVEEMAQNPEPETTEEEKLLTK